MKIGLILKILWRRHCWEVLAYLTFSCLLSGLLWKGTGESFYKGLAGLEVASLVWLVTRVALTQPGYGTFGGWRSRPSQRSSYWFGEILFLAVPLLSASLVRIVTAAELLKPTTNDWPFLWESWGEGFFQIGLIFVVCKIIGIGLEENDTRRARPRLAWGIVLTLVVGSFVVSGFKGKALGSGGTMNSSQIDPRGLPGVMDWHWLRAGYNRGGEVSAMNVVKLPLEEGTSWRDQGIRVKLEKVSRKGDMVETRIEVVTTENCEYELSKNGWLTLAFPNGYFGSSQSGSYSNEMTKVPLIGFGRRIYRNRFFTPLLIPENELSPEELLEGTELWLGLEDPKLLAGGVRDDAPDNDARDDEEIRTLLASYFAEDMKAAERTLKRRGGRAMEGVLAAAPWCKESLGKVVIPYLIKHAGEDEKERLLALLRKDPLVADVFFKKGWLDLADPILRQHLEAGKTLSKDSLIHLANLDEDGMAPRLENQLLRLSGDIDKAALAVRGHPDVDWDRVRLTAWNRMAAGFGSHHVWALWGAEMGEKEALRVLLAKANSGHKWELGILNSWFGNKENLVEELRDRWDEVEFVDGKWRLPP